MRDALQYVGGYDSAQSGVDGLGYFLGYLGGHQLALVGVDDLLDFLRDVRQIHVALLYINRLSQFGRDGLQVNLACLHVHRLSHLCGDVGQFQLALLGVHRLVYFLGHGWSDYLAYLRVDSLGYLLQYLWLHHATYLGVDGLGDALQYIRRYDSAQSGVDGLGYLLGYLGGHQLALVSVHSLFYHLRDVGQVYLAALHVYLHLLQSRDFLLCGCGLVLGRVVCLQVALLACLSHFRSGSGQLLVGVLQVAGGLVHCLLALGGGFSLGCQSLVFGGSFVLCLAQTVAVAYVASVANGLPSLLGSLCLLLCGLCSVDGASLQLHCSLLQCLLVVLLGLGERLLSTLLWGLMCGGGSGAATHLFDFGLYALYLCVVGVAALEVLFVDSVVAQFLQFLQLGLQTVQTLLALVGVYIHIDGDGGFAVVVGLGGCWVYLAQSACLILFRHLCLRRTLSFQHVDIFIMEESRTVFRFPFAAVGYLHVVVGQLPAI